MLKPVLAGSLPSGWSGTPSLATDVKEGIRFFLDHSPLAIPNPEQDSRWVQGWVANFAKTHPGIVIASESNDLGITPHAWTGKGQFEADPASFGVVKRTRETLQALDEIGDTSSAVQINIAHPYDRTLIVGMESHVAYGTFFDASLQELRDAIQLVQEAGRSSAVMIETPGLPGAVRLFGLPLEEAALKMKSFVDELYRFLPLDSEIIVHLCPGDFQGKQLGQATISRMVEFSNEMMKWWPQSPNHHLPQVMIPMAAGNWLPSLNPSEYTSLNRLDETANYVLAMAHPALSQANNLAAIQAAILGGSVDLSRISGISGYCGLGDLTKQEAEKSAKTTSNVCRYFNDRFHL